MANDNIEYPGSGVYRHDRFLFPVYGHPKSAKRRKRHRRSFGENPDVDLSFLHEREQENLLGPLPVMKMTQGVHRSIHAYFGSHPFQHEQAGLIIGPEEDQDLVTHFIDDPSGTATAASFTIDAKFLNSEIQRVRNAGLAAVGLIHSHPPGICRPSYGDLVFLDRLFSRPTNGADGQPLLFPIFCGGKIYPYLIDPRDVHNPIPARLVLV